MRHGTVLRLEQLLAQAGYLPLTWSPAADPPKPTGEWNEIVRGAVMMFQHEHHLDVDAFVGPQVWGALLADTLAGRKKTDGYSYVYVHRNVPQSLTLWHNGQTILSSPGNTGVPAAPTQLGTFPVFEHIPIGTMSGTNPDAPSPARASARRRASAASSSRCRPPRRCGPTHRSARSSLSKIERQAARGGSCSR